MFGRLLCKIQHLLFASNAHLRILDAPPLRCQLNLDNLIRLSEQPPRMRCSHRGLTLKPTLSDFLGFQFPNLHLETFSGNTLPKIKHDLNPDKQNPG